MSCCREKQTHVHEFLGSTKLAEIKTEPHNHRFAGVTGEAIRKGKSHVHRINTNTDFFDHFHMINVITGPAIPVGNGRHVHFVFGVTTCNDGHRHRFIFATLIDSPILEK
ncbi:hypothetical protein FC820_14895 [Clostridium sporogenes]|uniref:YmaF family protein n=1 Tax=Clostridium sporogenes TaxID=1509 RepID=UPI0013D18951|nr:YmaF family protein [Clostridium sporogenes]EJE7233805.1 YmaF family protein [Clostridium botulinum]NFE82375.1 hypothetical protein [Clostridium sporogenes]NFG69579.1 hypothetical protein [Clostridium sporogenes]